MPITQPFTSSITLPITRSITVSDHPPTGRLTTSRWWDRALLAAGPSLAAVAFAFGVPVHPRSFSRQVEIREGS